MRAQMSTQDQPTQQASHHRTSASPRSKCEYYIHGVRICRATFCFLHCMSQFRLDNIIAHYQKHGLSTCTHGNVKCLPSNSIPFDEVKRVSTFIENFARANGMPLPGRIPNHCDKVMILPADVTKQFVYDSIVTCPLLVEGSLLDTTSFMIFGMTICHTFLSPSLHLIFTTLANPMLWHYRRVCTL